MTCSIFDTLENKKKPFETAEPGHARIYVCGPTTYDDAHIGHARPCIVYDVLVRHLRASGTRVTYVRNVTDIDDKIINRAAENNEEPAVLAARMFESYSTDMKRLHNLEPDHQPKVSEHLDEIRDLVSKLIERGHAYESDGDVYFHVASCSDYGSSVIGTCPRWKPAPAIASKSRKRPRRSTRTTLRFGRAMAVLVPLGRALGDRGDPVGTSNARQ